MQIEVNFDSKSMKQTLTQFIAKIAADVEVEAKKNTPIKTGNARKGWNKSVSDTSAVINNKVPYIGRLEAGASRQAPKGILGPTLTAIKGKYK